MNKLTQVLLITLALLSAVSCNKDEGEEEVISCQDAIYGEWKAIRSEVHYIDLSSDGEYFDSIDINELDGSFLVTFTEDTWTLPEGTVAVTYSCDKIFVTESKNDLTYYYSFDSSNNLTVEVRDNEPYLNNTLGLYNTRITVYEKK